MDKPKAPSGLKAAGRRLWKQLTNGDYEFNSAEIRILEDACREADIIDRIEGELGSAALVVSGSQGQPVASPLVQEVRQHRMVFKSLVAALKLPDDEESSGSESDAARTLAFKRHYGA